MNSEPMTHAQVRRISQIVRLPRLAVLFLLAMCVAPAARAAGEEAAAPGRGWYTASQAQRGEAIFTKNCLVCHGSAAALKDVKWPVGFKVGNMPPMRMDEGFRRLDIKKYPSVYYLFGRIRDSMPAWGANTVSLQEKADIVAYFLKLNEYPVGPVELTPDVPRMKTMWFVERDFVPLFNGVDFTGWKFVIGPNCRPAPLGCGKTEPAPTFRVEHGEFMTDGKIDGYAYTEKKYRDFTLRFDYRLDLQPD